MRLSPKCRAVLSGEDPGVKAGLLRCLLVIPAALYQPIIGLRNACYNRGWKKTYQVPVPVICVGNLTVGGTGKTPMVIWLCRLIQRRGLKVAVLSRGYKAKGDLDNDETALMRQTLPDVPIVINPNRVEGAREAIQEHNAKVLVLDDGFQHRRLARDLDIVLIDCTCPFGYDHILPRGLLREPKSQLRRAHVAVLSRCDMIEKNELSQLEEQVEQLLHDTKDKSETPPKVIVHSQHQPVALLKADGSKHQPAELKGKKIFAFCGIGNPQAFEDMLTDLGADVIGHYQFGDHYVYDGLDAKLLLDWRGQYNADWLVTTEKDWVKLKAIPAIAKIEDIFWLKVETRITQGKEELGRTIVNLLEKNRK
jgi:tetraacyldisaccharide 4'-kinase